MYKAIEINKYGEERIVDAEILKSRCYSTISVKEHRFICPQCGEYLVFVRREKFKSYFKHSNKNEYTKLCELRSSGGGYSSLYEKKGLSLYVKKCTHNLFDLQLGFTKLREADLDRLEKNNAYFQINSESNDRRIVRYNIDRLNFFTSETAFKKLDKVSNRYKLKYDSQFTCRILKQYWGEEVEGIENQIGLFSYGELGGKLIRYNEEINTNTRYYLVAKSISVFDRYVNFIEIDKIGDLKVEGNFQGLDYKVYEMEINLRNHSDFINLKSFFRSKFKLKLVKKENKISVLWPPTINVEGDEELILDSGKVFINHESFIEDSFLIVHSSLENKEIMGESIDNNNKIYCLNSDDEVIALSSNGNNYIIEKLCRQWDGRVNGNCKFIKFLDINDLELTTVKNYKLPYKRKLRVNSNYRCKVIHEKECSVKSYNLKENQNNIIDNIEFGDKIYIEDSNNEENIIEFKKDDKVNIELDERILLRLLTLYTDDKIEITKEVREILSILPKQNKLNKYIRRVIFENKISRNASDYIIKVMRKRV